MVLTVRVEATALGPVIWTDVAEHEDSFILEGVVQVNEIVPRKPSSGVTEKVAVLGVPGVIEIGGTEEGSEKSSTVTATVEDVLAVLLVSPE